VGKGDYGSRIHLVFSITTLHRKTSKAELYKMFEGETGEKIRRFFETAREAL
jgi:hypothetical protein